MLTPLNSLIRSESMTNSAKFIGGGVASISRRRAMSGAFAACLIPSFSLDAVSAEETPEAFVGKVIGLIEGLLNSEQDEGAISRQLEEVLLQFAATQLIARTTLGPPWRGATESQRNGFVQAFRKYLARKYLKRLPWYGEGRYEVVESREVSDKSYEVVSLSHFSGQRSYELRWHVVRLSEELLIFNLVIDGVNMLRVEQSLIRNMLRKRNSDLDVLISDLAVMG